LNSSQKKKKKDEKQTAFFALYNLQKNDDKICKLEPTKKKKYKAII